MSVAFKCDICMELFEGFPEGSEFQGTANILATEKHGASYWKVQGTLTRTDGEGSFQLCGTCWVQVFRETTANSYKEAN